MQNPKNKPWLHCLPKKVWCVQAPASTSANTLGRQESHVTPFVNVSSQPGNSSSRKWAGAAADITKFVIEPGDEPVNASVTAAALTHILEFPEDLDGPDKESLMSVIDPAEFKAKKDFNGLVAPTSRMFRAPGR